MSGDNLSVISDITIAATRTQGARMRDKFRENLRIVVPAALATMLLLAVAGGLDWLAAAMARFARGHRGRRTGEASIAALAATSDVFTANNTVAIR